MTLYGSYDSWQNIIFILLAPEAVMLTRLYLLFCSSEPLVIFLYFFYLIKPVTFKEMHDIEDKLELIAEMDVAKIFFSNTTFCGWSCRYHALCHS